MPFMGIHEVLRVPPFFFQFGSFPQTHVAAASPGLCLPWSMLGTQCWMLMLTRVWEWGSTGVSPPQVASMNQRRVDFYLASIEDMLVAVGGRNENGALSSVETYSPKTDSWSYVAGLPR